MELHHLRIFLSVFKNKSFSKASHELHLAQPTISEHIKTLERELNCSLFERLGKKIIPTREADALYNLVLEWQWCQKNPVERVSRDRVKNERDRWLSLEEEKKLLECCVLHPTRKDNIVEVSLRLQEIVLFALNTGMRQDEILSLEWSNADLFRKTILVVKSKNGEKRTIPMNQKIFELLKVKARTNKGGNKFVFASETGTKIHRRNLMRAFYNARDRAKIIDFHFHDLRHTFATRLAQAGVDLYQISKLLGHKDIKMTQRYAHHCPDSLRSGAKVLDKIITFLSHSNEKGVSLVANPLQVLVELRGNLKAHVLASRRDRSPRGLL